MGMVQAARHEGPRSVERRLAEYPSLQVRLCMSSRRVEEISEVTVLGYTGDVPWLISHRRYTFQNQAKLCAGRRIVKLTLAPARVDG